ncbi:MAG: DUF1800 domain-containing protein [Rhodospirillaceae bacterium]|nr:MAG: DUF1800 domain-containing protein [Rhodospirillaceae bacterium]
MTQDGALVRHVIDRVGYGPRAGDLDLIASRGVDRWLDDQINPSAIAIPADLTRHLDSLATLRMTPTETFVTYGPPSYRPPGGGKPTADDLKAAIEKGRVVPAEAVEARLLRAISSPRQLEERMVEFWFNHFNVFVGKGLDRLWVGAYEQEAIRPHVLGKFRDLLGATAKHPAMLFYLDNWQNTAPGSPGVRGDFQGLNENYARELMELHTLGVNGGYTQDDVVNLARILTGWGFARRDENEGRPRRRLGFFGRALMERPSAMRAVARGRRAFYFDPDRHDTGTKTLLGRAIPGRRGDDGVAEGEEALDMLAQAPATARHISYQLAQFFVADAPDPALVETMANTFQSSGGDIKAVVRVMLWSAAFRDPAIYATRFKTPYHYVLSAVRATGIEVRNIKPLYGMLAQLGQPLYGCQTPDGFKCTTDAWLNADAMTRRISFAVALGAGRLPLDADPDPQGFNARRPERMAEKEPAFLKANGTPVATSTLMTTLGDRFSQTTVGAVNAAAPPLQPGLLLGSPEFMKC